MRACILSAFFLCSLAFFLCSHANLQFHPRLRLNHLFSACTCLVSLARASTATHARSATPEDASVVLSGIESSVLRATADQNDLPFVIR